MPTSHTPSKPYTEQDLSQRMQLFETLQSAAREITLPLYSDGMEVENKADRGFDPVTNADKDAERVLRALIQKHVPNDAITGEEFPDISGSSAWTWTLDPIDGTRAFVAGVPVWSTLIALSYDDKPIVGLIDLPALGLHFFGTPDGAWRGLDGQPAVPIQTRKRSTLSECVLGCTEPLAMFKPGELAAYNVIRRSVQFSRLGLDAYGHGLVASGKMDIILESDMKPCDVRALIPILEGAGGRMTNWHGGSCVDGGTIVAVGDPELLPELYTYLGRAIDD